MVRRGCIAVAQSLEARHYIFVNFSLSCTILAINDQKKWKAPCLRWIDLYFQKEASPEAFVETQFRVTWFYPQSRNRMSKQPVFPICQKVFCLRNRIKCR